MNEKDLYKKYYKHPKHDYELTDTTSITDDNDRHPDICFIYSGRERGKSFDVAMRALTDAYYHDRQFGYIRRYKATNTEVEEYFGDKTQLTAITFGANEGMGKALIVWLACSIGLFAADMVGMAVGLLVKNKMPTGFLNVLAYVIFAIFGVLTLKTGFMLLLKGEYLIPVTIAIIVVFIILSVIIYIVQNKTKKTSEELK